MIALGCIADDYTGGTDVAAALQRSGLSVALLFGLPSSDTEVPDTDAVVIALKTRTVPAHQAVSESLVALSWLRERQVQQLYFKYCSTFDSTDRGNIGPVADALLDSLGEALTLVCPASPEHGRTTYRGHLFVGNDLLSESSMAHHPLTPMTDPRIDRVLARQTTGRLSVLSLPTIHAGAESVRISLEDARSAGVRYVVVDAVETSDLDTVAAGGHTLLRVFTGGAGLAGALGAALGRTQTSHHVAPPLPEGPGIVLAGSCSAATLAQVAVAAEKFPAYRLDPARLPNPDDLRDQAMAWLGENWKRGPVLMYSSAGPEDRERAREAMGQDTSEILESILGDLARQAMGLGARRVVVAGGETSGAVVQAIGVDTVVVTGEEDRGVPWCLTTGDQPLALLLKSGNFGTEDLLVRALTGTST